MFNLSTRIVKKKLWEKFPVPIKMNQISIDNKRNLSYPKLTFFLMHKYEKVVSSFHLVIVALISHTVSTFWAFYVYNNSMIF